MKIKVDGVEYPFPQLDDLTMDETILLERVSGVGVEQISDGDSLPIGVVKAFVMIAIMRADPATPEKELAEHIGKIKLNELGGLLEQEAETTVPPADTPEPAVSDGTSGGDSTTVSGATRGGLVQVATGRRGSDTLSASDRGTSAA